MFTCQVGAIHALNEYIQFRIERDIEHGDTCYRKLRFNQTLIYSGRGAWLSQNTKRRTLDSGERRDYKACDSLLAAQVGRYAHAGNRGV